MSSAAPSTSRVRSVNKTLAAGRGTPVVSLAASQRLRPGRLRSAGALFRGGDGGHAVTVRSDLIAHNGKSDTPYA